MIAGKMVYDPHPSEDGLTAITETYMIFKNARALLNHQIDELIQEEAGIPNG